MREGFSASLTSRAGILGVVRPVASRSRLLFLFWLSILFSWSSHIHANDFSVGGSGADLVPLKETRVRMQSESILMVFRDSTWTVTADYVFVNDSRAAVAMQVGFPEILCSPDVDCNARFWDLRTTVDGKSVKHRQGRLERSDDWSKHLGTVWLFDVTFAPGVATKIRHAYHTTAGGSVYQDASLTYVTRTGAAWAGNIGSATFTLKLPPEVHTVSGTLGKPTLVEPKDGPPHVELKAEYRNWSPTGDLDVNFHFAPELPPHLGEDRLTRSGVKAEDECVSVRSPETATQLQMCKNLVYAISGFPFKKPELRKYFYGGWHDWKLLPHPLYQPAAEAPMVWMRGLRALPSHDVANMPDTNKRILAYLDDEVAQRIEATRDFPPTTVRSDDRAQSETEPAPPLVANSAGAAEPAATKPVTPAGTSRCGCSLQARSASAGFGLFVLLLMGRRWRPATPARGRAS